MSADSLNAEVAERTFEVYHRANPCTVLVRREGRDDRRLPAVVLATGAEGENRARSVRTVETRTVAVDRQGCPEFQPRRGDTFMMDEKGYVAKYIVGTDADLPAVRLWTGHPRFLKIVCRQV